MATDVLVWTVAALFAAAFAFAVGSAVNALRKPPTSSGLSALAPLIGAQVEGHGTLQWANGRYEGRLIRVRMMAGRTLTDSHGEDSHYNAFETIVLELPGVADWRIHRSGVADDEWELRVEADDPTLRERLLESDALKRLDAIGNPPSVRYLAAERALYLREDVTPRLAPTPERFRGLLSLAHELARINERVNALDRPAAEALAL
ncbi:MAG TPA: hypothetical protein VM491_10940 [Burkholderiaceae bacterium]|nr:hypothetical protein [Burkholderiaceae bacterium]